MDLSFIYDKYLHNFCQNEWEVNQGWCYVWAWLAKAHLKNRATLYNDKEYANHGYVKHNGLYYDAEYPLGTKENISHFGKYPIHLFPHKFLQYWSLYGRYSFENQLNDVFRKYYDDPLIEEARKMIQKYKDKS